MPIKRVDIFMRSWLIKNYGPRKHIYLLNQAFIIIIFVA